MINVKVIVPKGINPIGASEKAAVQNALSALGVYAIDQLTMRAQSRLSPMSGDAYIHGLRAPESLVVSDGKATITLVGTFPNSLEGGAPGWDIKKAMLAATTKVTKHGKKIVNVPFEHGTPGTTGKQSMPKAEHSLMQSAIKKAKQSGMTTARGPSTMPTRPVSKKVKIPGESGTRTYEPKRGPYDSMIHTAKKTGGGGVSGRYFTIRRISENSDPASWIHPGLQPLNFFPEVAKLVEQIAPKMIKNYLWGKYQ
jgi:hypothetical protein